MLSPLAVVLLCVSPVRSQDLVIPAVSSVVAQAKALSDTRGTPDDDSVLRPKEPLGNFHEIVPGFYRSAQPTAEGFQKLKDLGVKTILDLKESTEDDRGARDLGIKIEHVGMFGLSTPSFEKVDRALDVIKNAQRPLLVHCEHGQDRTGFVVASYRVTVQGWPIDKAVAEAKSYGCCFVTYEDLGEYLARYQRHRRALP